eukprot:363237-Chlamydomonas_euryale.AAC.10
MPKPRCRRLCKTRVAPRRSCMRAMRPCRSRPTGAATSSGRQPSSSGRAVPAACMTASASLASTRRLRSGRVSGCSRDLPSSLRERVVRRSGWVTGCSRDLVVVPANAHEKIMDV